MNSRPVEYADPVVVGIGNVEQAIGPKANPVREVKLVRIFTLFPETALVSSTGIVVADVVIPRIGDKEAI